MREENESLTMTWKNTAPLIRVASSAVKIAERAGKVIKQVVSSGDLGIVEKTDPKDLQTLADRAAQYSIMRSFEKQFGEGTLTLIGEEEKESECETSEVEHDFSPVVINAGNRLSVELRDAKLEDFVIWIDPLDGTSEFAQGVKEKSDLVEQSTVMIGIAYRGRPVAGVLHQPFYGFSAERALQSMGRTIWAVNGCGVHGAHVNIASKGMHTLVTTRSHPTKIVSDTIEALAQAGLCDSVLRVGGAGYKVLRVLEGDSAYVFASIGCKKWDTAAPEAILVEAGGHLSDVHGSLYTYEAGVQRMNAAGVVATAVGCDHAAYIKHIPNVVKDKLPTVWPSNM